MTKTATTAPFAARVAAGCAGTDGQATGEQYPGSEARARIGGRK